MSIFDISSGYESTPGCGIGILIAGINCFRVVVVVLLAEPGE